MFLNKNKLTGKFLLWLGVAIMLATSISTCNTSDRRISPSPSASPSLTITPSNTYTATPSVFIEITRILNPTIQPTTTPSSTATLRPPTYTLPPTLSPTATQRHPTFTATPTISPTPPFSATGPYLAYLVNDPSGQKALTLLAFDGISRQRWFIPKGAYIDLEPAISPDGNWAVFYTGSAGIREGPWEKLSGGPYNLTLNVMSLSTGQTYTVTSLLSSDYPANFERLADKIREEDPYWIGYTENSSEGELGPAETAEYHFLMGIHSFDWSSNSRYLAFAGQMLGDSSDVYIYDIKTKGISRLTSGIEQILWIQWSSDGQWIFHGATNAPIGVGMSEGSKYMVRPDGSEVRGGGCDGPWINRNTCVRYFTENGPGSYQLYLYNYETGKITTVWEDSFLSWDFNPVDETIAVVSRGYFNPNTQPGVYLIHPGESPQLVISGDWWVVKYRGAGSFVALDDSVMIIDKDGETRQITDEPHGISVSPGGKWMILFDNGLALYDEKNEFVRQISDQDGFSVVAWRLDLCGVFFESDNKLYYADIPDGSVMLVDNNLSGYDWRYGFNGFKWITK